MKRVVVVTVLVLVVGAVAPGVAVATASQTADTEYTQLEAGSSGDLDGSVSAGQGASLEITEVSREIDRPTVGQRQRFTVTIENDGTTPIKVDSVSIIPKENFEYRGAYTATVDFRVLDPGETLTVDLYHRFTRSGIKTLQARVQGEERVEGKDDNASVDVRRTFTMEVLEPEDPVVEFDSGTYSTELDNSLAVTVTNPGQTPIENVQVQVDGDVTVTNVDTRRTASIEAGKSKTFVFNVTADDPGEKTVGLAMKYDTVDGRSRTLQQRTRVVFDEPDLPDIRVSSVQFSREETTIKIDGRVGNIGQADAEGLSIGVTDADGVTPAAPQKTYIVGEVPQDEGQPFTLYATVEPGVDRVPLRITYSSNGVDRVVEEQIGPIPQVQRETTVDSQPVGAPAMLFGGLLLLGVLGFIGFAWYNAGSDDEDGGDTGGEAPVSGGATSTDADALVQSSGPQGGPGQEGGAPASRGPQHGQPAAGPQGGPAGGQQGGHAAGPHAGGQQGGHAAGGQQGGHAGGPQGRRTEVQNGGVGGRPNGDAGARTDTGGTEIRCDGCGTPYARDQVGSIAIGDGQTATACQDCQKDALMAAKRKLGAQQDRALEDGVDELFDAMSDDPNCDGCGASFSKHELEAMNLPDGSSALACPDCRDSALDAAREELTGRN